jgi:hypothetical protein
MFDSVVDLDTELVAQGIEQGVEHLQELANEEVYCMGLVKGKELGVEIGFYRGVVGALDRLLVASTQQADSVSSNSAGESTDATRQGILDSETIRIVTKKLRTASTAKAWASLREMVMQFPLDEPLSEANHDVMLSIRSKYKVCCMACSLASTNERVYIYMLLLVC